MIPVITIENFIDTLEDFGNIHNLDVEHSDRVAMTAIAIGQRLNGGQRLNKEQLILLSYAARIHDIGRVGVDNAILSKTGKLTKSQMAAMREHSRIGFDLLSKSALPYEITGTVLYHHEHWDGSGYPKGLKGLDIPLFARIVLIADTYDGIMSERPYHRARISETALDMMDKNMQWFDPKLYAVFLGVVKYEML